MPLEGSEYRFDVFSVGARSKEGPGTAAESILETPGALNKKSSVAGRVYNLEYLATSAGRYVEV